LAVVTGICIAWARSPASSTNAFEDNPYPEPADAP